MLSLNALAFAIAIYATITYIFKLAAFRKLGLKTKINLEHSTRRNLFFIISPDLWWATKFKDRIYYAAPDASKSNRRKFVIENNHLNLWVSFAFCALTLSTAYFHPTSYCLELMLSIAVIRFISRCIEILYAFVKDAFQPSNAPTATNLASNERIKLAAKSYVETYFLSAPPYLILTTLLDPFAAMSLSLNVGTLTNVGLAFADPSKALEANIVFIQVFTTLSLVVFSFAMYLARPQIDQKQDDN
ncbi:hypothetical protein [Pseudomonas sp. ABFPK]|uniref:hypothetical protein n=1 Tax=Pseudomonas sp. ABFPK TaxID=1636605 RepID=UPI000B27F39D|nr:hypothetical protein [Pseudomonas sp. ABFPK]